ncbi:hypothetical protein [Massilia aquatica]|uniref:Lipoprotein n=1 Tax=Massilia aquatica TaxID=2609000 RepID=A0ABX0M9A0_9BURK|nr:hypothetical protein [Massilia aquatica]NHZ41047.1 hypothetical protein [Massilia aquatica]
MKRYASALLPLAILCACDSSRPSDSLIVEAVASKIAFVGGTPDQISLVKNGSVSDVSCSAGEITTCDFEINKVKHTALFAKTRYGRWAIAYPFRMKAYP